MNRRDFLRVTGTFFASAKLAALVGCGDDGGTQPTGLVDFPQGVASGDPREGSVVLWTRAVSTSGATDPIDLKVEVATDEAFKMVVVSQMVQATAAADNTVRVVVDGLDADTVYYYRFVAGGDAIWGRTWTAPAASADVSIRIAWASCQDYAAGLYGAYKQMIADDVARQPADQVRFVLHLGDFIYETRGDTFQKPLDASLQPITLMNADGSPREIPPFPTGATAGGHTFASTVDDYRHIYKVIAADPDVRAARARWPFVHTWDDHEFSNDCWQSQANYTDTNSTDEASQQRRYAASQAFFEYCPMQLTGAPGVGGVNQHAKDFTETTVANAPFTAANNDNFVDEPNNVAAVGAITIYRSLRFGKHVELVVTDERSYRSDHAIPEEFGHMSLEYLDLRNVLPSIDLEVMDAGRTYNNNNPPANVGLNGFTNPRVNSPPGTMLGTVQKQWWKDTMKGSTATWKVWANEVPFMRFFIKHDPVGGLIVDRYMDGDAWDGYMTERQELTTYLRDQNVKNVLILTGDIHGHFAGLVHDNYTAQTPMPVATEFAAAGISSNSVFSFFEYAARGASVPPEVRGLVVVDNSAAGGSRFVENLNMLILHGAPAANNYFVNKDRAMALAASNPSSPHVKYADTNAQGFGTALVSATGAEVTLTTMNRPVTNAEPAATRTAKFTVPVDNPGGFAGPTFTGTPPFPFA